MAADSRIGSSPHLRLPADIPSELMRPRPEPKVEQWVAAQNISALFLERRERRTGNGIHDYAGRHAAGAFVGTDMVQDYAFAGGASATKATLLRSTRTRREYRLMPESKINLNSSLVHEVAAAPAVSPLAPQQAAQSNTTARTAPAAKLATGLPDSDAVTAPRFFNAEQFVPLRRLGSLFMPPGEAIQARWNAVRPSLSTF